MKMSRTVKILLAPLIVAVLVLVIGALCWFLAEPVSLAVTPTCYVSAAEVVIRAVGPEAEQVCNQLLGRGYEYHPGPSQAYIQCEIWGVNHNYKVTRPRDGPDPQGDPGLAMCEWLLAQAEEGTLP